MKQKRGPAIPAAPIEPEPVDDTGEESADLNERIVTRPDGFHWLARDGRQEFGPFETYQDALADLEAAEAQDESEPGAALREAEDEIGITDWIDPETGEPPEGNQSPPHLQEE